jgi:ubiquitin carboxyl-terminal hydrolase 5/13
LSTFPDYLIISVSRYIFEGLEIKKLNASIENTTEIDLSKLRGKGLQSNEELLPNKQMKPEPPKSKQKIFSNFKVNQEFVYALMDMSFPQNRCEKAVHMTGNSTVEAALEWLFTHNNDHDIDTPIVVQTNSSSSVVEASESDISNLTDMGFSREHAMFALSKTNNDSGRAVEWIFSHMDELDILIAREKSTTIPLVENDKSKIKKFKDGNESISKEIFKIRIRIIWLH